MAQYYEARMRDHAAAYASAMAGAAWAQAQIAAASSVEPQEERRGRRRRYRSHNQGGGSSSEEFFSRKKYPRKSSNCSQALIGKTGISALYEWCDKRRKKPKFILLKALTSNDCFHFAVQLESKELSRGRGGTKASAKQDAARRALQALLPGVVFLNGIVTELPPQPPKFSSPTSNIYPGTSTTSEDEDDNAYYASRGASVCSALLHAMWQINDLIPDPPSYSFEVRDNHGAHRGSFECTVTLVLKGKTEDIFSEERKRPVDEEANETLMAVGTGSTKREARHVASAKLLSKLFPECNGMVEVKAAAEAPREKYAASKALKLQSKRNFTHARRRESASSDKDGGIAFCLPGSNDYDLPKSMAQQLKVTLGLRELPTPKQNEEDEVSVESLSLSDTKKDKTPTKETETPCDVNALAVSRKQQLEELIETALQLQNEVDEEGRSIPNPAELKETDIGRTVLRRGEPGDARYIRNLLRRPHALWDDMSGPLSLLETSRPFTQSTCLWGPLADTILLCRAIAPHDEPPLGCAILTLGFNLFEGRVLRVAEIASEPHLPRERFVECLEKFAQNMNCKLEIDTKDNNTGCFFGTHESKAIVDSYLYGKPTFLEARGNLQAVKEEEPDVDLETDEPCHVGKDKPSKRSRTD